MPASIPSSSRWPKQINAWYQASRPRSLTATYVPVALGAVIAWQDDHFHLLHLVLALIGVLFLQISANLINEYYDYTKGSDKQKTHGLGMIIARGLLTPRQVLVGGGITLALGTIIGLYFVAVTGPLVLYIGIAAVLVVVLYTAGPYPLAYIGLGEIAVFVFMGPLIVIGTYFVMAEAVSAAAIWGGLPVAFLVADLLHANNLRDLEADRVEKKYTLATIFGRRFARGEYVFLTAGAFVVTPILVLAGIAPAATLSVMILVPEAWRLIRIATQSEDASELHQVLLGTARLHKWFGVVYVVAWGLHVLLFG
ncbi:MAG: 1,4-dihydroxy-2-naphthoate octaprenyltransferase [Chloroflexi bacterium]|nr:1,4-dihydroxy-2-naphthoate octaprenyltransferase [Chloroflexota bacterium]